MNRKWLTFLIILLIFCIGFFYLNQEDEIVRTEISEQLPTYQSDHSVTRFYNAIGGINYQLNAEKSIHFAKNNISHLTKPKLILFDEQQIPLWNLNADQAKLEHNNELLFLTGNIELQNINDEIALKEVFAKSLLLNLKTRDVSSDEESTFKGDGFISTGYKLRGNLNQKNAQLIDNVKTIYRFSNE